MIGTEKEREKFNELEPFEGYKWYPYYFLALNILAACFAWTVIRGMALIIACTIYIIPSSWQFKSAILGPF